MPDPSNTGVFGSSAVTGTPTAQTAGVQTLTFGGTPTGGNIVIGTVGGTATANVSWTATDATLVARVKTAVESLPGFGSGNTTTAAGTVSSGIGTITITGTGALAATAPPTLTVLSNNLAGTAPTAAFTTTTTAVPATAYGLTRGSTLMDTSSTGPRGWINVGTALTPSLVRTTSYRSVTALTATTTTGAGAMGSWTPTEGGPAVITRAFVYATTASTGAANINVGVATNSTTSSNTLITAAAINGLTVPAVLDNITNKGGSGKEVLILPSGSYVTASCSADSTGFVGYMVVEYMKVP